MTIDGGSAEPVPAHAGDEITFRINGTLGAFARGRVTSRWVGGPGKRTPRAERIPLQTAAPEALQASSSAACVGPRAGQVQLGHAGGTAHLGIPRSAGLPGHCWAAISAGSQCSRGRQGSPPPPRSPRCRPRRGRRPAGGVGRLPWLPCVQPEGRPVPGGALPATRRRPEPGVAPAAAPRRPAGEVLAVDLGQGVRCLLQGGMLGNACGLAGERLPGACGASPCCCRTVVHSLSMAILKGASFRLPPQAGALPWRLPGAGGGRTPALLREHQLPSGSGRAAGVAGGKVRQTATVGPVEPLGRVARLTEPPTTMLANAGPPYFNPLFQYVCK